MHLASLLLLIRTLVAATLGFLAVYWKTSEIAQKKSKQTVEAIQFITDNAMTYIDDAEKLYSDIAKSGGEKFKWVVDAIMLIIPDKLEWIITREMVEGIVQQTFEKLENYAMTQIDNQLSKKKEDVD